MGEVSSFLPSARRTLGLAGTTPEEAFAVRRDRATMTRDDLDNGRLVCAVAIASMEPAEFAVLGSGQRNDSRPATMATDDRLGHLRAVNFAREIDGRRPAAARRERSAKR
jgi:hypothetical protein